MPQFIPVDDDPFAAPAPQAAAAVPTVAAQPPRLVPVDDDPFAAAPSLTVQGLGSVGSTDPSLNPTGDGLTQDQIDAAIKARFAKSGAEGRANLAALPENTAHAIAAAGETVPVLGAGVNYAAAALASPFNDQSIGSNVAAANQMDAQFDAQHPAASGVAKAIGGTVGTIGLLPEAGLGVGAGSLASRAGTAALAQGALGGADAAVRGQDVGDAALMGSAAGLSGPLAGAGLGAATRYVKGLLTPLPAELQGMGSLDRKWLAQALRGQSPADLQAASDALGTPGMLGERSPGLLDLSESVANNTGAGKAIVRDAFDARNAGTGQRVMGAVDDALGPAQNPTPVRQAIEDTRQAATQPYFAQVFQSGAPYTPEAAALAQRPAVASALQDAATSAANTGQPLPTIVLDAAGNPVSSDAAIQAYEAGQRPAVTQALANLLRADPSVGPLATQDALTSQRSAAADPLYAAYRQLSVPLTPDLAEVLNRPSVTAAIPAAERKAADQGRTIFAQQSAPASSWERDPLGSGVTPEFTGDAAPGLPATPDNTYFDRFPKPVPPDVPRPQTARDVIRGLGGVRDSRGDLAASGVDEMGPGIGKLLRSANSDEGVSADEASQVLAQLGYFGADTSAAMRNRSTSLLADALTNHPTYPEGAASEAWAGHDADMRDWQQWKSDTAGMQRYSDPAIPGRSATSGYAPEDMGLPPGGVGTVKPAPQLTPEGLDYLKRTLGDKIDTAQRAGNRDDARIYTGLQQQLLGAIESHPDPAIAQAYGAARQAYAGPSREIDALNAGRAAFGDNVTPEQVQREYGALGTDGERRQYRNGLFSAGRDRLAKAGDTRSFVDMVAGNDAIRSKFGSVAPHQEAIDNFNAAMAQARQRFTEAQQPTPEAWHQALNVLDARAAKGEPGIAEARDALATHLGQDPRYAQGRALDQQYDGLLQAMNDGRTALRAGPNALHPDDFAERFGGRTGAGQAAERVTMRAAVDSGLRQSANDYGVTKRLLQGDDGYNTAKLGTAFGPDAIGRLSGAIGREDLYKANQKAVMGGSPTGERLAIGGLTRPDLNTGLGGWWNNLYIDKPSTYLPPALQPQALGERFLGSHYEAARERVAPQLVKTGPEADRLVQALLDAQKRRGSVPPVNTDPLVKALAAALSTGRQQALAQ